MCKTKRAQKKRRNCERSYELIVMKAGVFGSWEPHCLLMRVNAVKRGYVYIIETKFFSSWMDWREEEGFCTYYQQEKRARRQKSYR